MEEFSKELVEQMEKAIRAWDAAINKITEDQKKLENQLEKTDDQLKKNTKTAKDLKTASDGLSDTARRFEEIQKNRTKSVIDLDKQRQKALQTLGRQEAKERDLIKAANSQGKSVDDLKAKIKALTTIRDRMDRTTTEGKKKFDSLTQSIKKSRRELDKTKISTSGFSSALKSQVRRVAGLAAGYIGLRAALRGLRNAFAVFSGFEKTFTNVLTLLSEADKKQWGGLLRKGAVQLISDFGFSIQDVNKALFDAISAGIPAGNAIDFLRENAILAIGGVTDLGSSVDGTTTVINAFKRNVSETAQITAAFFSAQKFGKTTVDELNKEIGNSAPIANSAGVSYQELLSTYAELTKQGIKTTDATTAIKAIITAVAKPTTEARMKFKELGISVGLTAVREQGLFNILQKVSEAAEDNADDLTVLIPNVRALTGATALGTEALADYDKILKIVNGDYGDASSLSLAFAEQQNTITQRANEVSGAWKAFILSLDDSGNSFGNFIKRSLGSAKDLLTWFSKEKEFRITWTGQVFWNYKKTEEEKTKLTAEQAAERTKILENQLGQITSQTEKESKRLKELYGDDFTSFDDIIQQKEGTQLKHLFFLHGQIKKEIDGLSKITDAALDEEKKKLDEAARIADEAEKKRLAVIKADNKRKQEEAKKQEEDILKLRKSLGVVSNQELFDLEKGNLERDKTFALLSEEDKQNALLELRKKFKVEEFIEPDREQEEIDKALGDAQIAELDRVFLRRRELAQLTIDDKLLLQEELLAINEEEINSDIVRIESLLANKELEYAERIRLEQELKDAELDLELNQADQLKAIEESKRQSKLATFEAIAAITGKEQLLGKAKLAYEAFQSLKLRAISFGIITTKSAETQAKAAAAFPPPFNIPFILQAIAQFVPIFALLTKSKKYKTGTKGKFDTPGEFVTSEDNKMEIVETNSGDFYKTTAPTLFTGKKGSRVYSNPELNQKRYSDPSLVQMVNNSVNIGFDSKEIRGMTNEIKRSNTELLKEIKNKPVAIFDNRMKVIGKRTGNFTQTYLDRLYDVSD